MTITTSSPARSAAASAPSPAVAPTAEPRITGLGVFSQVHGRSGEPVRDVYARVLDAVVAADELGVDVFWVGQHHVDETSGRLPSPWPLLAAAAERTRRIRLGTAVAVLPLEDPLRLAEDAAVVDVLSGGRVELGLGSGSGSERAYRAFGIAGDAVARRAVFDAKLDRLLAALEGAPLAPGPDAPTLVPAAGSLRERVWLAAGTVDRAAEAGRRGLRLLTGTFSDPQALQRAKIDAYLSASVAAGHSSAGRRVSAGRFVHTGPSRAAIEREVAEELARHQERLRAFAPELAELGVAEYLERVARYGTVEEVVAQLRDDRGIADVATDFHTILGLYPAAGDVTPAADVDIARIEELVTTIAPALGWRPAPPASAGA